LTTKVRALFNSEIERDDLHEGAIVGNRKAIGENGISVEITESREITRLEMAKAYAGVIDKLDLGNYTQAINMLLEEAHAHKIHIENKYRQYLRSSGAMNPDGKIQVDDQMMSALIEKFEEKNASSIRMHDGFRNLAAALIKAQE
jgi:hypothetical protein